MIVQVQVLDHAATVTVVAHCLDKSVNVDNPSPANLIMALPQKFMEKRLLRCYTVLVTLFVLFLIGYTNHGTRDYSAETSGQPAFSSHEPLPSRSESPIVPGIWNVVRVVDGDTMIVGDSADREKQYRVRLIGADTPEIVRPGTPAEPFGIEASEFVKKKIADANNRIRISFDGEQVDRYRRTLAMVYVQTSDGEVWLNELLIREGLARARLDYRYSHEAKLAFAVAEVEARKNSRNIWKNGGQ